MTESERCYYKSCDTLPIYNFYKILNTKDLMWLVKGYEGDEGHDDEDKLIELWEKIYEEYKKVMGIDGDTKSQRTLAVISEMELELVTVSILLKISQTSKEQWVKDELKAWKYDIPDPIKKLEALKFKLDILKSKNQDLINPEEKEENANNLYKDIAIVETSLGFRINPKETVVSQWAEYINICKKRSDEQRSNRFSR